MNYEILGISVYFLVLYGCFFFQKRNLSLFAPIKIISGIFLIRNVPYMLFCAIDDRFFNWRVMRYFESYALIKLDDAFFNYAVVQTLAFLVLIIGIRSIRTDSIEGITRRIDVDHESLSKTVLICFAIGVGGFLLFLKNIGGFDFLINNLQNRVSLQSGQHVLKLRPLIGMATVLSVFLIYTSRGGMKYKVRFVVLLLLSIGVFSSTGGRKQVLYLIVMSIAAYNFYLSPISFRSVFNYKIVLIVCFVIFYIVFVPILRSKNGFEEIVNLDIADTEIFAVDKLFGYLSYTYIDVFAVNHFHRDNIWEFRSLLTIPSNLFDRKESFLRPPIDEGTYFASSILDGQNYTPLIERRKLSEFSYPIENLGFAYANALFLGVVVFFYLQGVVFSYVYKLFLLSGKNPFLLYVYMFVVFNFNFSSLRIMNLMTTLFLLLFCFAIYSSIRVFNGRGNRLEVA